MLNVSQPALYLPSIQTTKTLSLIANNTTLATAIFGVTGSIQVRALWGVVSTVLSSNVTAAHWRENDATAQVVISAAAGTTLSALPVGSLITRQSVAAVALVASSSAAGAVQDPVAATAPDSFMPFLVVQKTGSVATNIEFVYTTTNTPATGAIDFYIEWRPLTPSSVLIAS